MQPYDQPTNQPTPKVAAVGAAGVILTLAGLLATVFHVTLPASFSDNVTAVVTGVVALVSIVHFVVAYFKKDAKPAGAVPIIQAGPLQKGAK